MLPYCHFLWKSLFFPMCFTCITQHLLSTLSHLKLTLAHNSHAPLLKFVLTMHISFQNLPGQCKEEQPSFYKQQVISHLTDTPAKSKQVFEILCYWQSIFFLILTFSKANVCIPGQMRNSWHEHIEIWKNKNNFMF